MSDTNDEAENSTSSREGYEGPEGMDGDGGDGGDGGEIPTVRLAIHMTNEMVGSVLNIVDSLGVIGEQMRERFMESLSKEAREALDEDENGDFAALAIFGSVWALAIRIFEPTDSTYANAKGLATAMATQYEEDLQRAIKIKSQGTDYIQ